MDYDAITDLFSNVIEDSPEKFLIVDAARFGGEPHHLQLLERAQFLQNGH